MHPCRPHRELRIGALLAKLGGLCCIRLPGAEQPARELGLGPAEVSTTSDRSIVWMIRVPRVLLGLFVGAALAVAGVVIQALVRNPLADPYLLGISSGASTGAAASILFGIGGSLGAIALTGSAFVGALLAIVLVLSIARIGGRLVTSRLVFAGIAVGFALTALTNFLVFGGQSRDGARAVMFWMLGSLARDLGSAAWARSTSLPHSKGGSCST